MEIPPFLIVTYRYTIVPNINHGIINFFIFLAKKVLKLLLSFANKNPEIIKNIGTPMMPRLLYIKEIRSEFNKFSGRFECAKITLIMPNALNTCMVLFFI
jgi:hypothetical protein